MNQATKHDDKNHDGLKVKRVREMLKVKQSTLAQQLGDDWTQKKISQLEDKEVIDDKLMEEIAGALNVPVEAIRNFDEEKTVMNIQNNYEGSNPSASTVAATGTANVTAQNYQCSLSSMDKLLDMHHELILMYERMIKEKEAMIEQLKKILSENK